MVNVKWEESILSGEHNISIGFKFEIPRFFPIRPPIIARLVINIAELLAPIKEVIAYISYYMYASNYIKLRL